MGSEVPWARTPPLMPDSACSLRLSPLQPRTPVLQLYLMRCCVSFHLELGARGSPPLAWPGGAAGMQRISLLMAVDPLVRAGPSPVDTAGAGRGPCGLLGWALGPAWTGRPSRSGFCTDAGTGRCWTEPQVCSSDGSFPPEPAIFLSSPAPHNCQGDLPENLRLVLSSLVSTKMF